MRAPAFLYLDILVGCLFLGFLATKEPFEITRWHVIVRVLEPSWTTISLYTAMPEKKPRAKRKVPAKVCMEIDCLYVDLMCCGRRKRRARSSQRSSHSSASATYPPSPKWTVERPLKLALMLKYRELHHRHRVCRLNKKANGHDEATVRPTFISYS